MGSKDCRPPQTIISVPVQTADASARPDGTPGPVEVAIQLSLAGSYRPPVFVHAPPQTINSVPVQILAAYAGSVGTPLPVEVAIQLPVSGSY